MSPINTLEADDDVHKKSQINLPSRTYHPFRSYSLDSFRLYHHDSTKKYSIDSKEFLMWLRAYLTKKHHKMFIYLITTCEWNMENIRECLAVIGRVDLSRKLPDWFC